MTMIEWLLKASAVMTVGFVVALACRRAAATTRHLVWTFVVAALLALPGLMLLLPDRLAIPVTPRAAEAFSRVTWPWTLEGDVRGSMASAVTSTPPSTTSGTRNAQPISIAATAGAIYAAGVLLLLLRLGANCFVARRAVQRAVPVHDPDWLREQRTAEALLGLRRPVALRRTLDHVMPFVVGTRRPTVLVPATADLWPDDRRRVVLLHELAHVSRLDCAVQIRTFLK